MHAFAILHFTRSFIEALEATYASFFSAKQSRAEHVVRVASWVQYIDLVTGTDVRGRRRLAFQCPGGNRVCSLALKKGFGGATDQSKERLSSSVKTPDSLVRLIIRL
jgi:hypothetical protein